MNLLWLLSDKGHCGIEGNERVDQLAKETLDQDIDPLKISNSSACTSELRTSRWPLYWKCVWKYKNIRKHWRMASTILALDLYQIIGTHWTELQGLWSKYFVPAWPAFLAQGVHGSTNSQGLVTFPTHAVMDPGRLGPTYRQGSTLIFKVTCPFGQVRFEIHLSCMRCHLSTNPNPCRNMGIVQFCATIFDFSPVPSDKWHCKTTCPRSHFQHFYLSWTVGQPLRSSPDRAVVHTDHTARLGVTSNHMVGFPGHLQGPAIDIPRNRYCSIVIRRFPGWWGRTVGPPHYQWPMVAVPARAAYQPIGNVSCDLHWGHEGRIISMALLVTGGNMSLMCGTWYEDYPPTCPTDDNSAQMNWPGVVHVWGVQRPGTRGKFFHHLRGSNEDQIKNIIPSPLRGYWL